MEGRFGLRPARPVSPITGIKRKAKNKGRHTLIHSRPSQRWLTPLAHDSSGTVAQFYFGADIQREEPDGSLKYVIVEVKADNQIEDAVVQAKKDFAQQIAVASGMEYRILKSSDADKRHFRVLL